MRYFPSDTRLEVDLPPYPLKIFPFEFGQIITPTPFFFLDFPLGNVSAIEMFVFLTHSRPPSPP